jgi:hypothetical protein
MDKKPKVWALALVHIGGLIFLAVLAAGLLPFLYSANLVYPGIGWYKIIIGIVGLLIAATGLFFLLRKKKIEKK